MKTTKKIETFRDGVLLSTKTMEVPEPVHPETGSPQNVPKHSKVLDLGQACNNAAKLLAESQQTLMAEVRSLRKKLLFQERQAAARLKERDSLKKALKTRDDKIAHLEEKIDDLEAQCFALEEDYEALRAEHCRTAVISNQNKPTKKPTPKITPGQLLADDDDEEVEVQVTSSRAIAAKPKK